MKAHELARLLLRFPTNPEVRVDTFDGDHPLILGTYEDPNDNPEDWNGTEVMGTPTICLSIEEPDWSKNQKKEPECTGSCGCMGDDPNCPVHGESK